MGDNKWGREKERPPDPWAFDGAPLATEKRVSLYVDAADHLANEYARISPRCHRTLRLVAAGNGG